MEFKEVKERLSEKGVHSINRIRLEFKDAHSRNTFGIYLVLIESDWNLKDNEAMRQGRDFEVLIESDWNLK